MSMLSKEEIKTVFVNTYLEENYNFLEEDLVTLAIAFVKAATPKIQKAERERVMEEIRNQATIMIQPKS
jgi:pyrroloquinoline quinone (PQQ) biosynthesis protein C